MGKGRRATNRRESLRWWAENHRYLGRAMWVGKSANLDRCEALTRQGSQCQKPATHIPSFCAQHAAYFTEEV